MSDTTIRFGWSIPGWDADYQKWQRDFRDLINNQDATIFAIMESNKLLVKQAPAVQIVDVGGGSWELQMADSAIFISRTLNTEMTIPAASISLLQNSILVMPITPGATGSGTTSIEVKQSGVDIAPEDVCLGYIDSNYNIRWYNGNQLLAGGDALALLEGDGSGETIKFGTNVRAGDEAGDVLQSGATNNVLVGYQSGKAITTEDGNVFIGSNAGSNETVSDTLMIENSDSSDPLVGGDFSNRTAGVDTGATGKQAYHATWDIDGSLAGAEVGIDSGDSPYTVGNGKAGDKRLVVYADADTAGITINLPVIADQNIGRFIVVKNIGSYDVTLAANAADGIEGSSAGGTYIISGGTMNSVILQAHDGVSLDSWYVLGGKGI